MGSEAKSSGDLIKKVLSDIRRRQRVRKCIGAFLIVAAFGFLVLTFGKLTDYNTVGQVPLAYFVVGFGLATLAVVVSLITYRTSDLSGIARKTETRFKLSERLSSALEVHQRSQETSGPIARALMSDASARAEAFDKAAAEPLMQRSTVAGGVGLILAIMAFVAVPTPSPSTGSMTVAAEQSILEGRTTESIAEDLRLMARLIAEDAQERDDGFLAAVSSSLEGLAEQASDLSLGELEGQFSDLVDLARYGYGNELPQWMPQAPDQFGELGQRMAEYVSESHDPSRLAFEDEHMQDRPQVAQFCSDEGAVGCDDGTDWELWDQLLPENRPSMLADGGELSGDRVGSDPSSESAHVASDNVEMQEVQFEGGAGRPIGASSESGRGGGDVAGDGSQDYLQSRDFLRSQFETVDQMQISGGQDADGSRIQVDLYPEETFAEVVDAQMIRAEGMYRWNEAVTTRGAIRLDERAVVARYFARGAARSN